MPKISMADIIHRLRTKNKGRKPWVDEEHEVDEQRDQFLESPQGTFVRKTPRGNCRVAIHDDLYDYRGISRDGRFEGERVGLHLSRNAGERGTRFEGRRV